MQEGSSILGKSRHTDMRIHCLKELYSNGDLMLVKIAGGDNVADALAKSLASPTFIGHREHLVSSCAGFFKIPRLPERKATHGR